MLRNHEDSIVFGTDGPDHGKVRFEPFMGIGPRRFFDLFSMNLSSGYEVIRKKETGENIDWSLEKARLRVQMLPSTYLDLEVEAANLFRQMAPGQGGQDGRKEDHTTGTE